MNTLKHPSDKVGEFAISANYRQRYHSKPDRCNCKGHEFKPSEPCKHMILEQFISKLYAEVMKNIEGHRAINNPESAMRIKLMVMNCELQAKERMALNIFSTFKQRKECTIHAAWLLAQVKRLQKRVNLIDRMKTPVYPVNVSQHNTEAFKKKQACQHARVENRNSFGNRCVSVVCLDCRQTVKSEWSASC